MRSRACDLNQRCKEQLLFFTEVPDRSSEVEVEEVIGEVSTLGDVWHLRYVEESLRLGERMMVVIGEGIRVSCLVVMVVPI
jgi:hypothetical protein